jgi:hypothetical protein
VLVNERQTPLSLLDELEQGRYLLETHERSSNYIFFWILNASYFFKHFKFSSLSDDKSVNIDLSDTRNMSKKLMYKCGSEAESGDQVNVFKNDFNTTNFRISNEQYHFMVTMLTESNDQLCESLKWSNDYLFAIL